MNIVCQEVLECRTHKQKYIDHLMIFFFICTEYRRKGKFGDAIKGNATDEKSEQEN